MALAKRLTKPDADVSAVQSVLQSLKDKRPDAQISVRRYSQHSIRIRVLADSYGNLDRVARDNEAWSALDSLPDQVVQQITLLLLLTSEEAKHSLVNLEFEDPGTSWL